jgi:alkylated DNA repair dioxygenase AlkB
MVDMTTTVPQQLALFGAGAPYVPRGFAGLRRLVLSARSWLDHLPSWLPGSDQFAAELIERAAWQQGRRPMYDRMVDEPRLTAWYSRAGPLPHPLLGELFEVLSQRYRVDLDSVGLNWYRNGRDSVAWHGDRVGRGGQPAVVAIVSLGEARPFLVRSACGGSSRTYLLGGGDLLVMGGQCQREFQHCVPKVAHAGPRLSVTLRHGTEPPPWRAAPGI